MQTLKLLINLILVQFTLLNVANAIDRKVDLTGRIEGGANFTVLIVEDDGSSTSVKTKSNGSFKFSKLKASSLDEASLQLVDSSGNYYGPVMLAKKGDKGFMKFSGRIRTRTVDIGRISLEDGYAKAQRNLPSSKLDREKITLTNAGAPAGAGTLGLATAQSSRLASRKLAKVNALVDTDPGADQDRDGLPNSVDADDNGDGIADFADPVSAQTTAQDNPFTTLYLGMSQTKNVNVSGDLSDDDIDDLISGENIFSLIIYFSTDHGDRAAARRGHVQCSDSLVYCRRSAAGGGTAIYGGVGESDNSLRGQLWTDLNADGSGFPNLESIRDGQALVASIQPRVGASQFRPGDVYRVQFKNSNNRNIGSRMMTLSPYFITIPAVKTYNVGSGDVTVDYSAAPMVGNSSSNPIVIPPSQLLTLSVWRPQRQTVGTEDGSFRDLGHLHYGVIFSNGSQEFGCPGHYSNLSASLSETTPDEEDSPNLWPLKDSSDDDSPSSTNVLTFTVNAAACLAENSLPPGTYSMTLTAAGENLSGGANRAAQLMYVTVN